MFLRILKNKIFIGLVFLVLIGLTIWFFPAKPYQYEYGMSYSAKYARELGLDPEETFDAMTDEMGFRKIRLVAYWNDIEGERDKFDFSDLDWQMNKAEEKGLDVILALGRRVPRWPECHTPEWARKLEWDERKEELLFYMKEVVNRYKDYDSLKIWQVENEPFLTAYVPEICGDRLDEELLDREIALVRDLDKENDRPILTTDSGNLGTWFGAYKRGDIFGSTFYVYLANPKLGEIRTIFNHNYYRVKRLINSWIYGDKPVYLIEVSMEPWLVDSIYNSFFYIQHESMNVERIKEIIDISSRTHFDEQYLWGVEWWYYMKLNGFPEIWDYMKEVMSLERMGLTNPRNKI